MKAGPLERGTLLSGSRFFALCFISTAVHCSLPPSKPLAIFVPQSFTQEIPSQGVTKRNSYTMVLKIRCYSSITDASHRKNLVFSNTGSMLAGFIMSTWSTVRIHFLPTYKQFMESKEFLPGRVHIFDVEVSAKWSPT